MQLGASAPLHDENLAWCPIFVKKGAPYPRPNALFFVSFFVFRSECGKHVNQGIIQLKNQRNFPKERPKNFCAPWRAYFSLYSWRPLCKLPPSPPTSGWIRPCYQQVTCKLVWRNVWKFVVNFWNLIQVGGLIGRVAYLKFWLTGVGLIRGGGGGGLNSALVVYFL